MESYDYGKELTKQQYYDIQVERSATKFRYCRVSILDAISIQNSIQNNDCPIGPTICMGTRNGRELDLFRIAQQNSRLYKALTFSLERERNGFSSFFPYIEKFNRSDVSRIEEKGVYGVELNPEGKRQDTWVGSFDNLPESFTETFSLIYSNAFDHSLIPEEVAQEWLRIAKKGAFLVLHFVKKDQPSYTDPTGNIEVDELLKLFPGSLVCLSEGGSYDKFTKATMVIIRLH